MLHLIAFGFAKSEFFQVDHVVLLKQKSISLSERILNITLQAWGVGVLFAVFIYIPMIMSLKPGARFTDALGNYAYYVQRGGSDGMFMAIFLTVPLFLLALFIFLVFQKLLTKQPFLFLSFGTIFLVQAVVLLFELSFRKSDKALRWEILLDPAIFIAFHPISVPLAVAALYFYVRIKRGLRQTT